MTKKSKTKKKPGQKRDRTHKQKARGAYMTIDDRCVAALLKFWRPRHPVWEPACGRGDMVRQIKGAGIDVRRWSDIKDYGFPETPLIDFLKTGESFGSDVITNPPNEHSGDFARHALKLTKPYRGAVALLQRHDWDTALDKRGDILRHPAYAMKIVLPFRPYWFRRKRGEKASNPFHRWAWYLFDWTHGGPPWTMFA